MTREPSAVQRVRHTLKYRLLRVSQTRHITPGLLRITLTGDDLADFVSMSFDDHVKIFLPEPGASAPVVPEVTEQGLVFPSDRARPIARDYTPRRYDKTKGELEIEFALHGAGPAADWARQAKPGDSVGVGGPRGSFVIPDDFDWYLLAGDETALPAIGRRLDETASRLRTIVVAQVASESERVDFTPSEKVQVYWAYRDRADGGNLVRALAQIELPAGEGYVWAAGESQAMRDLRSFLTNERGVDAKRIRASSYWKQGAVGVHETIND